MAEQQLLRCREMAAELAHTQVGQAASIIIAVVNEVVADKRYQKPLVDFMVQNAHITLFRLLQAEKQALKSGISIMEMLDNLPENRPLYKDSGSWQIRTDDMEEVLYHQVANESFFDFIKKAFDKENYFME
jgi:hypothetical protein